LHLRKGNDEEIAADKDKEAAEKQLIPKIRMQYIDKDIDRAENATRTIRAFTDYENSDEGFSMPTLRTLNVNRMVMLKIH
jgi:hypothetical protein